MFTKLCALVAKKNRGFTLIELIVVIAILGILIAILVPSMIGFIENARMTSVKAEAKTVYTAMVGYYTQETTVLGKTDAAVQTAMGVSGGSVTLATLNTALKGANLISKDIPSGTTISATITNGVFSAFTYSANGYTYNVTTDQVTKNT